MELVFGRCRIRMDFGFPAMIAVLFLYADAVFLRQTFAVCMIHELGHGAAMLLTGAGIREIHLYAAGVQMRTHSQLLSKSKEMLIVLSGPCMNFAVALLLGMQHGWCEISLLHLGMGLFNLLPYSVLDGGSAIACLSAGKPRILRMQTVLCIFLSAAFAFFSLYLGIRNPCIYLMCLYLSVTQLRVDKQGGLW